MFSPPHMHLPHLIFYTHEHTHTNTKGQVMTGWMKPTDNHWMLNERRPAASVQLAQLIKSLCSFGSLKFVLSWFLFSVFHGANICTIRIHFFVWKYRSRDHQLTITHDILNPKNESARIILFAMGLWTWTRLSWWALKFTYVPFELTYSISQ